MDATPFEIKVVYDATRRRRGPAIRKAAMGPARGRNTAIALAALTSLAVAGAMYYVTWWQIDRFIFMTFMTRVPFDVTPEFATNPFGLGDTNSQPEVADEVAVDAEPLTGPGSPWEGKTAQTVIPVVAYGWLTLATAGACAVALASGAWLAVCGGTGLRYMSIAGVILLISAALFFGYRIWTELEFQYEVRQLRIGMGVLTVLMMLLGMIFSRSPQRTSKFAGCVVLTAALATPLGMWLWGQSGALDPKYYGWTWLATAFVIHAAWGIVLLAGYSRMRGPS